MEDWFEETVERFRREMRRLMREMEELVKPVWDAEMGEVEPLYDVADTHDAVVVRVDLPGVRRREDVQVSGHGNVLTIKARIDKPVRLCDIPFYSGCEIRGYKLELELAGEVDLERARAKFADGRLEVVIPRRRAFHVKVE